jgi:hypothetical protein
VEPTGEPTSRPPNITKLGWWVRLLDPTRYLREVERVRTHLPRSNRDERAESFVGAAIAIFLAIGLQYFLPNRVTQYQRWVFPTVAGVLLIALLIGHRERLDKPSPVLRGLILLTVAIMSLANGVAGLRLVRDLIEGQGIRKPETLLFTGVAIWLTNVIVFALVFWMFDRGGPVSRFLIQSTPPDLLFPQHEMQQGAEGWRPYFFDYFYTSFTNATAFSPTDVMPLARWAKFAMMLESSLSLLLAILVVARAVNILH